MGSCAFPSPTCPSGYVYDKTASGNAGKCVPVGSVGDDMAASMMDMAGDGFFTSSPDMSTGDMATGPIDMAVSGGPWMTVSGGSAGTDYQSIWGTDNGAGHIFIVGQNGALGTWTGANFTFKGISSSGLVAIWGSATNDLYTVGFSGTLLHSTDGNTWTPPTTAPSTSDFYYAVWGASGTDVYVGGYNISGSVGLILHSSNHGVSWQPQTISGVTRLGIIHGIWGSSATDLYAVGENGVILHSTGQPGGGGPSVWTPQTSNTTRTIWAVWGPPGTSTDVYAITSAGYVLHSAGGGAWGTPTNISTQDLQGIYGTSGTDLYVVGANGVIFHSVGGLSFAARNSSTVANMRSVYEPVAGMVIAVGTNGAIITGN